MNLPLAGELAHLYLLYTMPKVKTSIDTHDEGIRLSLPVPGQTLGADLRIELHELVM